MRLDRERWADIEGYPYFNVSSEGSIANIKTKKFRTPVRNQQGITMIHLHDTEKASTRSLAVLVAEAFVEGRTEIFNTPIHLNGDRTDCRAANLMWRPLWFAREYHRQFSYPEFHDAKPAMVCLETGEEFNTLWEPCMKYGILMSNLKVSLMTEREVYFIGLTFCPLD